MKKVPNSSQKSRDRDPSTKAPMMFGWIFTGHQLGAAVAAFGAGVLRTAMDGYLEAFLLAGLACLVAVAMSLMIGRQPAAPARVVSEAA